MQLSWWWRLQILQWVHAGRERPLRRAMAVAAWWLPCAVAPLVVNLLGTPASATSLEFVLSLDVPLALAVAALTTVDALRVEARSVAEDWLWPPLHRPAHLRWLSRLRWFFLLRWPAGLVLAAFLLASGAAAAADSLIELLLMAFCGLLGGASFAWVMHGFRSSPTVAAGSRRARGMAALSWVPLHAARERFDLRRAAVFAVPALLAAPLGAMAGDVAAMLAVWLPAMFVMILCREAMQAQVSLQHWLRPTASTTARLAFWLWRYVLLGIAVSAALFKLWPASATGSPARPS